MDNTVKIVSGLFIAILLVCVIFLSVSTKPSGESPLTTGDISVRENVTVYFFYGEECPHCHNVMPFIQNLTNKYPEVDFQLLETWHNETNQVLSRSLHQKLGLPNAGVPEVIIGNVSLVGDRDIPARLESVIIEQIKKKQ